MIYGEKMHESDKVTKIKGVGEKRAQLLEGRSAAAEKGDGET